MPSYAPGDQVMMLCLNAASATPSNDNLDNMLEWDAIAGDIGLCIACGIIGNHREWTLLLIDGQLGWFDSIDVGKVDF